MTNLPTVIKVTDNVSFMKIQRREYSSMLTGIGEMGEASGRGCV